MALHSSLCHLDVGSEEKVNFFHSHVYMVEGYFALFLAPVLWREYIIRSNSIFLMLEVFFSLSLSLSAECG